MFWTELQQQQLHLPHFTANNCCCRLDCSLYFTSTCCFGVEERTRSYTIKNVTAKLLRWLFFGLDSKYPRGEKIHQRGSFPFVPVSQTPRGPRQGRNIKETSHNREYTLNTKEQLSWWDSPAGQCPPHSRSLQPGPRDCIGLPVPPHSLLTGKLATPVVIWTEH